MICALCGHEAEWSGSYRDGEGRLCQTVWLCGFHRTVVRNADWEAIK